MKKTTIMKFIASLIFGVILGQIMIYYALIDKELTFAFTNGIVFILIMFFVASVINELEKKEVDGEK